MLIPRAILSALAPIVGHKANRHPRLRRVQIDTDGTVAATDGTLLLRGRSTVPADPADFPTIPGPPPTEPDRPVTIAVEAVAAVVKALPTTARMPVLTCAHLGLDADGAPRIHTTDLASWYETTADPLGTAFPDVRRVVPANDRPELQFAVGVGLLERVLKTAKAIKATTVALGVPTEGDVQATPIRIGIKTADVRLTGVFLPHYVADITSDLCDVPTSESSTSCRVIQIA